MFDALDFLAEVSAHVPDVHEKTTLFYGGYSNWTRGYRTQQGRHRDAGAVPRPPVAEDRAALAVRRSWARGIQQGYEVDPLLCPRCGGMTRVIAVIEQRAVIRQILGHLNLAIPSRDAEG